MINVISREALARGEISAKRKAYIRSIYSVKTKPKKPCSSISITFLDEDLKGIQTLYDDPVMVLIVITNFEVRKILVNSGNTAEILFYETF